MFDPGGTSEPKGVNFLYMTEHEYGNRITSNAKNADDAKELIEKALRFVQNEHGFHPVNDSSLFKGLYYDSKKVGSYITQVVDTDGHTAVLKLQLRPLPFDEGSIIRSVEENLKSEKVRPVRILFDQPWNEEVGFGYLLFEDITHLPNLWRQTPTTNEDRLLHKKFLDEFFVSILPVEHPWVPFPKSTMKEMALAAFQHFKQIADESSHRHISDDELKPMIEKYQELMTACDLPMDIHFTHGHLSGFDVKYDSTNNCFIFMANLYWSWRPEYYELAFPLWVDLMHIRDKNLTLEIFVSRVNEWVGMYGEEILGKNFWYILLQQTTTTIMLDLGASEWEENEFEEKQTLFEVWKKFFNWLIKHKLTA